VHKANLNLAFQVMESDLEVRAPGVGGAHGCKPRGREETIQ